MRTPRRPAALPLLGVTGGAATSNKSERPKERALAAKLWQGYKAFEQTFLGKSVIVVVCMIILDRAGVTRNFGSGLGKEASKQHGAQLKEGLDSLKRGKGPREKFEAVFGRGLVSPVGRVLGRLVGK